MSVIQKGKRVEISNGAVVAIYELQPNGDLIKLVEKVGGIVIWRRK